VPHTLTRSDVDLSALAAEMSGRLGRTVALSARMPGQTDQGGNPVEGMLLVLDPATGEELNVDGRTVSGAIRSHTPPPSPAQRREQAIRDAERKAAAGDTAGALADVLALLAGR
jgi:hypothetical protein